MKPESPAPWLLFFVILAFALLVAMAAGCASHRYEAAVQVESSGDEPTVVASFKLVN